MTQESLKPSKSSASSRKAPQKFAPHVSDAKKNAVDALAKIIAQYPIIAVLNLERLPARQLQKMKTKLRKDVEIRMAKKAIICEALKHSDKKDIAKLQEYLSGMPALLLTKENPFRLFKIIKQNKSAAAIKPGQITPKDLVIPAGPTPFAPGPIIGELGQLKIKAGIEAGKVVIKQDAHVASKGDVVNGQLASLLLRLGFEPMEIGLDLVAVYEHGEILTKDVLDIDEDVFMAKLHSAVRDALGLSLEIAYPTRENIEMLVQKSFRESKAIALECDILADAVVDQILAKANAQASALAEIVNK